MSPSSTSKDDFETVQLSTRGDVLLSVGKEDQPSVRLLVSSALLSQASSIFAAMFDGRFSEGQDLSSDAPREILLPDDDPESMKILAKVIHFRADDVAATLSLDSLAEFAVLCDKYDCTQAATSWSRLWVAHFLADPNMPGLEKLLFITYVLDLPEEFRQVTKVLIQHRTTAINFNIAKHGLDLLPNRFLEDLQEAWNQNQDEAVKALQPSDLLILLRKHNCTRAKSISLSWFQNLAAAELTPIRSVSLDEMKSRVRDFNSIPLNDQDDICTDYSCPCNRAVVIRDNVLSSIRKLIDSVKGFCLDCVMKQATGNDEQACRIPHD